MKLPINFIYRNLKPLFFSQDAETAHEKTLNVIENWVDNAYFRSFLKSQFEVEYPNLKTTFLNRTFKNPIGLAAGFDKDGRIHPALYDLGFGYVEIGTVTPRPQTGNPQPRLFRLIEDQAVINRMGFNNLGAESMAHRLTESIKKDEQILGINIGKNKTTSLEKAADDYVSALTSLYDNADYFTINISSPNTENLRSLQEKDALSQLLKAVCNTRDQLDKSRKKKMPLLVKIAPDWNEQMLNESMQVLRNFEIQGVIATNTTIQRPNLVSSNKTETGGLSGKPLTRSSTEMIRRLYKILGSEIPIIGVGGIFNGQDAYDKIKAGAVAVQIYTALIYEGPGLVLKIKKELSNLLEKDGFQNISEAVGLHH